MSLPLASGPSLTLHFNLPTNGTPDVWYQYLMQIAQTLQGMTLSILPSMIPTSLEVPLQLAPAFQAHPTAPPPRPSPQLVTALAMGTVSLPPTQTPFTAQHYTLPSGGQPLALVGVQYPSSPEPNITPV